MALFLVVLLTGVGLRVETPYRGKRRREMVERVEDGHVLSSKEKRKKRGRRAGWCRRKEIETHRWRLLARSPFSVDYIRSLDLYSTRCVGWTEPDGERHLSPIQRRTRLFRLFAVEPHLPPCRCLSFFPFSLLSAVGRVAQRPSVASLYVFLLFKQETSLGSAERRRHQCRRLCIKVMRPNLRVGQCFRGAQHRFSYLHDALKYDAVRFQHGTSMHLPMADPSGDTRGDKNAKGRGR